MLDPYKHYQGVFIVYPLGGRAEKFEGLPFGGSLEFQHSQWGVMKVFSCQVDPNAITTKQELH